MTVAAEEESGLRGLDDVVEGAMALKRPTLGARSSNWPWRKSRRCRSSSSSSSSLTDDHGRWQSGLTLGLGYYCLLLGNKGKVVGKIVMV